MLRIIAQSRHHCADFFTDRRHEIVTDYFGSDGTQSGTCLLWPQSCKVSERHRCHLSPIYHVDLLYVATDSELRQHCPMLPLRSNHRIHITRSVSKPQVGRTNRAPPHYFFFAYHLAEDDGELWDPMIEPFFVSWLGLASECNRLDGKYSKNGAAGVQAPRLFVLLCIDRGRSR